MPYGLSWLLLTLFLFLALLKALYFKKVGIFLLRVFLNPCYSLFNEFRWDWKIFLNFSFSSRRVMFCFCRKFILSLKTWYLVFSSKMNYFYFYSLDLASSYSKLLNPFVPCISTTLISFSDPLTTNDYYYSSEKKLLSANLNSFNCFYWLFNVSYKLGWYFLWFSGLRFLCIDSTNYIF